MPAITIDPPPLALDPATRKTLLQSIVDGLPIIPNASDAERTALREAAFALLGALSPTDPVEAMLAAQIITAHFACMNAYRCAARPDLPPALHVRYQTQAAALSRLTTSKRRELQRRQASQPTLPAGFAAAHAAQAQAQATAKATPAQPPTQAPQPKATTAQRPATTAPTAAPRTRPASPSHAAIDQLLAEMATKSSPKHDADAPPDAKANQPATPALSELTQPLADLAQRLHAEAAARKAATTTKLAA